tara:strand:+ start:2608 stop:9120 length:6513 start_codon:yes stop_codon:yes gene_type:complete
MVSYQINGKIYDLPEEEVQGFLNEFPDAVIVEEDETVEKPIPSPEESAPVEENVALDNMVSEPVDTSLELPTTYKVDGKIYDLPKEEVAGFLSVFTDAEPYEETSIEAVDNLIEEPKEKDEEVKYESAPQYIYENVVDFVQDLGDAWNNGVLQGEQTDKGIELAGYFNDPATEKEVIDWIDGQKKVAQQNIQSAEMREFDRIYEEAGGGMWGFLKGAAYNPSILSTTLLSSIASQYSSIKNSEEVAVAATAGAIAGSAFSPVGTLIGVTTGSMAMMEAGLTFNELMMEEIGGDINDPSAKEKIRAVLNDPEKMTDLRRKAGLRGAVIAGVELATLGMARGVAGKLASKALPITGLAAGGAIEIVGGGLGEVGGRLAAGQEMDAKEIGFEAFAGLGSAPISLGSQALKLQTAMQTAEAGKKVRASDFNSLTEVYSNENSNSETAIEISKLSKSVKIVDREVNEKVNSGEFTQEEGNNIKKNFRDTQGAVNRIKPLNFNTEQETKAVELLKEKQQLTNEIKEVDEKALTKPQQERVDAIDKELNDLRVERATETITEAVDPSRVILVENDQELQNKYNIKGANYSAAGGFFKDGKFYINKEVAGQFETITEPSHELLHPILKESLKANPQKLVNEFKKVIGEYNVRLVQKRIDGIDVYTDEYMESNPDEFITQFGDMILEGEITYNDNIFTKLGDYITPLLRKFGFKKIKFDTGRDVYNFMREYSKGIERGKLSEDVKAVIPTELQSEETFSIKKASVLEDVNKLVPQDITTQEEYQSFINDPRAFPKLYSAITKQGGVINNYIKSISTTPEEAQKTIENLTNRILKFNPEAKRKGTKKAVGIEAFGERIFADIQFAKKGSKLELFQESERTQRESRIEDREDGFEVAAETEVETTAAPPAQGRKLVKKQALSEENQKALEKVISEADFTEEQLTFKTLPNAAIEIFAKEIGIPAKKFAGSSNFTQGELEKVITYIEENIDIIRQALPQAAVLEGASVSESLIGTATGVPNNLLKDSNLYTRKERTTKKAGIVPYEKNKGIDNSSILKAIGIIDGKRTAGPRDKQAQTAKGLINVLAKFATNQEVRLQKNLTPQQQTNIETGKGSTVLFSTKNPVTEENVKNALNNNTVFNVKKAIVKQALKDINTNIEKASKLINQFIKYNTTKEFETALAKLNNKVDQNFVRNYFDNKFWMFGVFADEEVKNRGIQYEKYVNKVIKALSLDNVSVELLGGNNPNNPDLKLKIGNTNINIELKLNAKAQMGSFTIRPDGSFSVPGIENLDVGKQIKKQINSKEYKNALKNFNRRGVELGGKIINGQLKGPRDVFIQLQNEGLQSKLNINNIIGNEEVVNIIYNQKEIYTIEIGDKGLLYLGENKYNVQNLPKLEGEVKIYVRRVRTGKGDNKTTVLRAFPTFISDINKSLFNLSDPKQVESTIMAIKQGVEIPVKQENTDFSIKQAATKNNNKLPTSQKLPKGSTNEQVLAKMRELDNQANEERAAFSAKQNLNEAFNDIIEAKTGIATYKRFSPAKAEVRGASKGKFNFFIPPSAEDFTGLLYKTLAKGKLGDRQMQWYKDNLLNPYARAMNNISAARVAMFEDYKKLKEDIGVVPKDLKKKSVDEYTREQAIRTYIWNEQGNNIPGLFKTDQKELVDYINNDAELKLFADKLISMQKGDVYAAPKEGWLAGTITTDLLESVNTVKRKKYLEQWQTNVDEIFSEENMNKLEAAFGKPYRKALEGILTRMKTGRNKPFQQDSLAGRFTNWLNNSVGAIMFFNTRSAVLQLISTINFVNFTDNNPLKAGAAFANQPQYWKDFLFLANSDFLKERRGGLRFNVSESEIADMAKQGGMRGVLSKLLQAGFLPTQLADSAAIALGGATFYRNRIKTYTKQGLSQKEAQDKAFIDFRETAEESQQSSRPDRISAQQAGPLGRTILAFANTPAQYARLTKKALSDLVNGRGDFKTNLSKLAYYGFVQNLIFTFLQQALFAVAFGDDEEEEKKKERKYVDAANSMADGFLRGIGIGGAITATIKNALIRIIRESEKARPDYAETTVIQLLGISPPVQSKAQKIRSALKSYEWNKDEMKEKGFSLDNPAYLAGANVISASTNVPLDRVVKKVDNIQNSTRDDITTLQRIMLLAGWSDWQLDIKDKPKPKQRGKQRKINTRGKQRKFKTR